MKDFPTLLNTWSQKKVYPFRGEPPRIAHHGEYPSPRYKAKGLVSPLDDAIIWDI